MHHSHGDAARLSIYGIQSGILVERGNGLELLPDVLLLFQGRLFQPFDRRPHTSIHQRPHQATAGAIYHLRHDWGGALLVFYAVARQQVFHQPHKVSVGSHLEGQRLLPMHRCGFFSRSTFLTYLYISSRKTSISGSPQSHFL